MAEFWERNKEFLTQVLSGAGAFLVLSYFILGIGAEGPRERREIEALTRQIAELQRRQTSDDSLSDGGAESLRQTLERRLSEVCVGVPAKLAEETSLRTRFLSAKAQVCAGLERRAAQEAVDVKQAFASVDFHEREPDGVAEYENHWASLETFRRFLDAVLGAGFSEIRSIVCEVPFHLPIPGAAGWEIARYGVRVDLSGRFEDLVRLYADVAQPGRFVLVAVDGFRARTGDVEGVLSGTLTGYGVRLLPVRKAAQEARGVSDFGRFKR